MPPKTKMNITEFRKQYPEYDNVSNDDLSKALWEKDYSHVPYEKFSAKFLDKSASTSTPTITDLTLAAAPDWADVPSQALENTPESAKQFASDIWQMISNPVDTVSAVVDLGKGVASKVIPGLELDEAAADAFGEFIVKRYGGDEGDALAGLRRTLANDPVGALGDLSAFFTAGGMAVAKGAGIASKGARQFADAASNPLVLPQINRRLDFSSVSPAAGAVATGAEGLARGGQAVADAAKFADPMYAGFRGAGEIGRRTGTTGLLPQLAALTPGLLSGTGGTPIIEAAKAGFAGGERGATFRQHMRGGGDVRHLIDDVRSGLEKLRANRNAHYKQNIAPITKDATVLDYSLVDDALEEAIANNTLYGKTKSAEAGAALEKIKETVAEFRAEDPARWHTVEGMDFLKQRIGSLIDFNNKHADANRATQSMYHAVADIIKKQAPDYAEVMSDYSRATNEILEIEKTLSVGGKATDDTIIRKLTGVMRNNANTNYGLRKQYVERLDDVSGKPIIPAIAGQALNTVEPRGLARAPSLLSVPSLAAAGQFINPAWWAGIPLSSPRLVGETAHLGGRLAGLPKSLLFDPLSKVGITPRGAAAAVTLAERADEEQKRQGGLLYQPQSLVRK